MYYMLIILKLISELNINNILILKPPLTAARMVDFSTLPLFHRQFFDSLSCHLTSHGRQW